MMPESPFYQGLLGGAVFSVVLAVAGGLLTRLSTWYYALKKPWWKPPDWAFGPIWTVILALVALSVAYTWEAADAQERKLIVTALAANGILHVAWSGIFFALKDVVLAFLELLVFWLSIVALIWVFGSISRTAAILLLPYLAWVSAAGLLNYQIMRLNPR
jgi:tryptophan-rich sensory protein